MRYALALALPAICLMLNGCVSERHFASDSWPFGNPNAPDNRGETALRALGQSPDVTPIPPQAGNVWPGAVQPVPTIADIEKNMNTPLGQTYVPSLPSPYPPGQAPVDQNSDDNLNYTIPTNGDTPDLAAPAIVPNPIAPSLVTPDTAPNTLAPPGTAVPGTVPEPALPIAPANPHARE